jgi:AAA15 family ATPase/GTPase
MYKQPLGKKMYTSFRIQNFRGFRDLQLNDLARVNLIAGKNNTGKTSVLEAALLYSGYYSVDLLFRTDSSQYIDRQRQPLRETSEWSFLFHKFDTSQPIVILCELSKRVVQQTLFPDVSLDNLTIELINVIDEEIEDLFLSIRRYPVGNSRGIDLSDLSDSRVLKFTFHDNVSYMLLNARTRIPKPILPAIFIPSRERISNTSNADRFTNLKLNRMEKLLIETIQVIEKRLYEIILLTEDGRPVLYGDIGLPQPIPLSAMGEGINRMVSLILAISSAEGGIVAIDAVENGLHYSVLKDVWKAIYTAAEAFNVQVFATTHSYECIQAAHQAFTETQNYDFRLHRLDRTPNGDIHAVTYDQEMLQTSIELEFEVR